jgi:hypothetical protein
MKLKVILIAFLSIILFILSIFVVISYGDRDSNLLLVPIGYIFGFFLIVGILCRIWLVDWLVR